MHENGQPPFRIKAVEPDLPHPREYAQRLEEMHGRNFFTNFGPLNNELAEKLTAEFALEGEICVPCGNATVGLSAALIAAGVRGKVLLPAFTFPATMSAIRGANLHPIVMDVDPLNWAIPAAELEEALSLTGAKAVILVAPFGMRTDFSEHMRICRQRGAAIVIDCAAGMGGERINPCLEPDIFEIFSFHATKPFGVGEGGVVFCSTASAPAVRSALNFGLASYQNGAVAQWGLNGKMSELHAAVGLAQIARYRDIVRQRQLFVEHYGTRLADLTNIVYPRDFVGSPWQIWPVLLPSESVAGRFVAMAAEEGIEIRRYYRPSLSNWPGVEMLHDCSVSEDLASRMVALPVRRIQGGEEIAQVIEPVCRILRCAAERED